MKKHIFKDADNGLMWDIIPSINEKEPNNKQTLNRINKYTQYLNTWNDKDIIKFIVDDEKFGDFIKSLATDYSNEYTTGFALNHSNLPFAVAVLSPGTNNYSYNIEYVIVDSNYRNHGIGTRIIASLRDNIHEFIGNKNTINEINCWARNDNFASQKAILKNKFICKPAPANSSQSRFNLKIYTYKINDNSHSL